MTSRSVCGHVSTAMCALALLLICASPVAGQSEMLYVNVVQVKPESWTEWQEFQKEEVLPALKKAGIAWRGAWRTAMFGNPYECVLVSPIEKLAEFDEEDRWVRALGEDKLEMIRMRLRSMIESSRRYAMVARPELGFEVDAAAMPELVVAHTVRVSVGRNLEFESFLKNDIAPVLKKAGISTYSVSQTLFGGPVNEYVTITSLESYASLDKGDPLTRVLGKEGYAKLLQKATGLVESVQRVVARIDTDLSYGIPGLPKKTSQ